MSTTTGYGFDYPINYPTNDTNDTKVINITKTNDADFKKLLEFNNNAYSNDTDKNKFIDFSKLHSENNNDIKKKLFWVAKNTNNMFRFNQTKDFDLYQYQNFNDKKGYLFYKIVNDIVDGESYIYIKPDEITSEPGKLKSYNIIMYTDTDKYEEYFFDFKNTSSEITNKNNSSLLSRFNPFNRPATGGKKRRTKKTIKTTKKAGKSRRKTNKK